MTQPKTIVVEVRQCSKHGYTAVMLCRDDEDGGRRVTDGKCCGSWDRLLKRSVVDVDRLKNDIAEVCG